MRLEAALRLARQEVLMAMTDFERVSARTHACRALANLNVPTRTRGARRSAPAMQAYWSAEASRDHATGDPWLTQMVLKVKLARLVTEEQQFNTSMISFHAELAKIDAFLMENVQV